MEADIIKQNPMLKEPLCVVLQLASETSDELELIERAEEVWSDSYAQAPATTIDILVRHGALESQTFMNGEPYDGTLEDMQLDESVPDDAVAEVRIALTDEGQALYEAYQPLHTLKQLLEDRPQYAAIFTAMLEACDVDEGLTRQSIEALISDHPDFKQMNEGSTRIYPQYFIDALETAGGISWNRAWQTTEAGKELLTQ